MQQSISISNQTSAFLPLELATKYYSKWDCDIQIKSTPKGYYKCLQGYGQVQFANNNSFKGNFLNGLMHGQGQFIWANGLKYTGPFLHNSITGNGTYEWKDGSWYKGELLNGKRHGKGQYFCSKDNSKYKGQWKNGLRNGFGVLDFTQQTSYQGYFNQGLRHGKGKMKYSSGNTYEGEWKNDKKCGFGVMNWFTQNQKYQGEWLDDLQHGLGTYYWFDGKIQYKIIKNIYKGNWVHGERDGFGSFFYANGCRYEGYFNQNKKHGNGLVLDQNGNIKLQFFQKDKLVYTIPQKNTQKIQNQAIKSLNINKNVILNGQKNQKPNKTSQIKTASNSAHDQSLMKSGRNKILPSVSKNTKQNTNVASTLRQQPDFPPSHILNDKQAKYKIQENIYSKCMDIPTITQSQCSQQPIDLSDKFYVCKQIMNLLLRQNSRLRQWYKHCSLAISSTNGTNKDFYTGVTIQNMFKLIKDLKIMDQQVGIPQLNRQFYFKGWKSVYDVALPQQKKLQLIKDHLQRAKINKLDPSQWAEIFNSQKLNYWNIEWNCYAQMIENNTFNGQQNALQKQFEHIDLNVFNDIHHPKKIILFRHFVCYLLKIAFLQTQKTAQHNSNRQNDFQKQFRNNLQKLFKSINVIYQNAQRQVKGPHSTDNLTFVSKQKNAMNVSEEFSKLNEELFSQLTKHYQNFNNYSDNTVNVRLLYQLMQRFSILKQPAEKILFLEKIQRFMEPNSCKTSLLRKQLKNHFNNLQKVIYESPYFERLLNYTLIQKQFQDLLYLAVNRKINTNSKEQALKKYKEILETIISYAKKETSPANQKRKKTLKVKKIFTQKDRSRQLIVKEDQQRKIALIQSRRKQIQQKREQVERFKMGRQDFRWQEDEMEQSDEYFD